MGERKSYAAAGAGQLIDLRNALADALACNSTATLTGGTDFATQTAQAWGGGITAKVKPWLAAPLQDRKALIFLRANVTFNPFNTFYTLKSKCVLKFSQLSTSIAARDTEHHTSSYVGPFQSPLRLVSGVSGPDRGRPNSAALLPETPEHSRSEVNPASRLPGID